MKTFVFSYALAHLEDGEEPNTREELLRRICEFFDVLVSTDQLQVAGYRLQIYPNPAMGISNINYQIPNTKHVKLSLLDLYGKEIILIVDEVQTNGEHREQLVLDNLAAGIYLLKLQAGEEVFTEKLVVMR